MALAGASWQLDNGLAVKAISDPAAASAAALVRIEAGSFQAPTAWPGLAHLLEHMLFRGSENFSAQDSLMGWVPSVGGRLNATTQATQTAFFFEVGADHLAQGLARLSDMLAAPQLAAEAIAQEIEVIDAEYRLLRAEVETAAKPHSGRCSPAWTPCTAFISAAVPLSAATFPPCSRRCGSFTGAIFARQT